MKKNCKPQTITPVLEESYAKMAQNDGV